MSDLSEYIPFGKEWENEVKKWNKDFIVSKLKKSLLDNKELQKKYDDLSEKYDELLIKTNL